MRTYLFARNEIADYVKRQSRQWRRSYWVGRRKGCDYAGAIRFAKNKEAR